MLVGECWTSESYEKHNKSEENRREIDWNNSGMFGPIMVKMYLNNTLNSFIDFFASDWYNKIPISLF